MFSLNVSKNCTLIPAFNSFYVIFCHIVCNFSMFQLLAKMLNFTLIENWVIWSTVMCLLYAPYPPQQRVERRLETQNAD